MQFDDPRGCPGYWLHIHGRTAGLCLTCSRFERGGPQMTPPAVRHYGGQMDCEARLNDGHALSVAPDASDSQHLPIGGAFVGHPTDAAAA